MTLTGPKRQGEYEDRKIDCQWAIENEIALVIDRAQSAGWKVEETLDAVAEIVRHLRQANADDPDPAEDPILLDEPSTPTAGV